MFVQLAMLESARCIDEEALDDAWGWVRAANRSGGHSSHRGCIIHGLVGMSIHATATAGMARWAEQPHVTSGQLKAALAELKADYSMYESESNILRAEYLMGRNTLLMWPDVENTDNIQRSATAKGVIKMGFWIVGEPELSLRIHRQVLANQIREFDKPAARRRRLAGYGSAMFFDPDPLVRRVPGQLDQSGIKRGLQRSYVAHALIPDVKRFEMSQLWQAGRQATIEVVLAAQAYRRDHGEFPPTLQQLVPDYLGSVPLDPCDSNGGPLLYRRDDVVKAVVWSVGDDGVDSGGTVVAPANALPADVGFEFKLAQ